jgi:hypothetical protein
VELKEIALEELEILLENLDNANDLGHSSVNGISPVSLRDCIEDLLKMLEIIDHLMLTYEVDLWTK